MENKSLTTLLFLLTVAILIVAAFVWTLQSKNAPTSSLLTILNGKATPSTNSSSTTPVETGIPYAEIINSCGPYFDGTCVNMRSGPGLQYPAVLKLRTGIVLEVDKTVIEDGQTWFKLDPGINLRYPERVTSDWYVSADFVNLIYNVGDQELEKGGNATTTKKIVVDIGKQMLYAYDGKTLFMQEPVSTGLPATPTPHGTFEVYRKTPSRYMQGPVPGLSDQYYDLPGVPWDLYFTDQGGAIHGTYWHNHFGEEWSHGCVNLPLDAAEKLYQWTPLGTPVIVID
jgi:lipoprotein-anchoring transpeptidase ErfK/SrfK